MAAVNGAHQGMGDVGDPRSICSAELEALCQISGSLTTADLVLATHCTGWSVADLLVHIRAGAEELVLGWSEPTDGEPDRDFVTYWRDWPAKAAPTFEDVRTDWAMTSAFSRAEHLLGYFRSRVGAAARAVERAPHGRFRFQGHVMEAQDMAAMWAVEFAVHHLDLMAQIPGLPPPAPGALSLACATLDRLTGAKRPNLWSPETYVLKGTGRLRLTPEDAAALAGCAGAFPAFG
ncbi:MAG TPA: maleylpyruvate isomerase N-terminal domain-containing protein [Acidimicrobiales bacterium]|nr:maleylpyruvate isomerase N-terminal domain-containing protein [Acidimicrobiales bacterium]